MYRVAMLMLVGDRSKYLALVLGLSFAVLLISQQGAIFLGLMKRATGPLQNVTQPDLWVADTRTRYIGEVRPLNEEDLYRVRSAGGVLWAQPFFASRAIAELPSGKFHTVQVIGVDRTTMIGGPAEVTEGRIEDMRGPDAVFVEESGRSRLENIGIGDTLKLNDRRAMVVGFCRAKLGFESNVLIFSTFENAAHFVPMGRRRMSYILVKAREPAAVAATAAQIERATGLGAYTPAQMEARTIRWVVQETGIGINFGITVVLGFVVGLVVAAAILYQFTTENVRHFAVLKAMGAPTRTLVGMIFLQASAAGAVSYGIGVGLASVFGLMGRRPGAELAADFPWQLAVAALVALLVCVCLGSLLSIRRVLALEPGIVFK